MKSRRIKADKRFLRALLNSRIKQLAQFNRFKFGDHLLLTGLDHCIADVYRRVARAA